MQRRLAIAVTALVLGGGVGGSEAPGVGAPGPRSGADVDLRAGEPGAVTAARTGSWRGGVLTAATGELVRIEVSDAYAPEAVSAQAWADFFAGLLHGRELASVTVRVGTPLDVLVECGFDALACYSGGLLVIPGEQFGGMAPEELARHEYGHHVAASRANPPWRAVDWGPKRWASQAGICTRAAAGTAFPDSDADYERHPGEAFAEVYRVLNERRSGSTGLTWSIVDDSFIPDAAALRAAEDDVTRPWAAPVKSTVTGRFEPGGPQQRLIALTTPLDGALTAELQLPRGRLDTLELLSADGRVLARGLWAGTSTRRLSFTVCGQRRLTLRVSARRATGRFQLIVTRP